MTGICGWFDGAVLGSDADALLQRMAARIPRPPDSVVLHHATGPLGVAVVGAKNEASLHVEGGVVAAILGKPQWHGEFAEIARRDGDAAALSVAFTRRGRGLFEVLAGHTAIFAADATRGIAVAAIDRTGIQRLCYASRDTGPMIFGSTTNSVRAFPGMGKTIAPQSLFDFLYFNKMPAPATIFTDQKKLLAAQYVWREGGRSTASWYWRMPFEATDRRDAATLGRELRDIVQRAVTRAHDSVDPAQIGAFLSGGLDSSTVAGMLGRNFNGTARAFSIGFEEPRYDERHYARITAKHFGVRLIEHVVTADDLIDVIPRMAAGYDEPFANSSAILVYCCAKMAREHGVTLMLAGDGGDEIFGGNARYVFQKYFELYAHVPRWFRRFALEPAVGVVPYGDRLPLVRRARSYVAAAAIPLPERLQRDNFYALNPPSRILAADLLPEIDHRHPVTVMQASYDRAESASVLQHMFALDIQLTLADDDLRKVTTMCEAAGTNVHFPLLDDEVTEFAAHLPPELCIKGFDLRHFYKEAFRGFLADETITKPKHGFGMPFETWLENVPKLREIVNDSILRLKSRRLFNPQFLDEVMSGEKQDIEVHSHDVHWALMLLELWLERHVDAEAF